MRKYIIAFIVLILVFLSFSVRYLQVKNDLLKEENSILINNQKAYVKENSILKKDAILFKFTVEQLNYYNDSILSEMKKVQKDLKIKDDQLKAIYYLNSQASKKDTVIFRDTLFRDPYLRIDTIIGDMWYSENLSLRYPDTIITNPKFISDKYIILNTDKQTIDPPKKFFIARWFQKKQTIIEVNIVEKNPYIKTKEQKFIEIIK